MVAWLFLMMLFLGACASSSQPASIPLIGAEIPVEEAMDRIEAATPAPYARFASSVSVDGDVVAIGAWGEASAGSDSGAVYVYERGADAWTLQARLTPAMPSAGARFGHAIAIEGGSLLVGAPYDPRFGVRAGAVYVFEEQDGAWLEQSVLGPAEPREHAFFGSSVDLSEDTALIGASGFGSRSVHVFRRSTDGWDEVAELAPASPSADAHFGSSVAIHGDLAVVGAWTDPPDDEFDEPMGPSSALVFERLDGAWVQRAQLMPAAETPSFSFGRSVAVTDGLIAIGAPDEAGAAYVFQRDGTGWTMEAAFAPDSEPAQHFGSAVAVDRDLIVVGAPAYGDREGTAYMFARGPDSWESRGRIAASEPTPGLQLAGSIAMNQGWIVLGATGDGGAGPASGAAFAHR